LSFLFLLYVNSSTIQSLANFTPLISPLASNRLTWLVSNPNFWAASFTLYILILYTYTGINTIECVLPEKWTIHILLPAALPPICLCLCGDIIPVPYVRLQSVPEYRLVGALSLDGRNGFPEFCDDEYHNVSASDKRSAAISRNAGKLSGRYADDFGSNQTSLV